MSIIYRTTGPWGVGKGSNLSAAEVDGNFYDHEVRIEDLETTRPQPDNFANVTIEGTQIKFTLVSGAVLGPLDLPVLKWRFRGDWAVFTGYAANDTFRVAGDGLYLVLVDHTSAATFDPAAYATGDTVAAGGLIVGRDYTILTVGTTDFTLIGASANTIGVSFTATGAGAGTGTATLNQPLYFLLFGMAVLMLSETADYNVTVADSGGHFDNIGAAGEVDFTLPVAERGLHYSFLVDAAQIVKIIAQSGEQIASAGANSAAGGNIQSATPYDMISIKCHKAGQWVVASATGSWTLT